MSADNDGPFDLSDAARGLADADLPDVDVEGFDLDEFVEEIIDVVVDAVTDDVPDAGSTPELAADTPDYFSAGGGDPAPDTTTELPDVPDLSKLPDLYGSAS